MAELHRNWQPLTPTSWAGGRNTWLLKTDRSAVHMVTNASASMVQIGGPDDPTYSHWQSVDESAPPIYADVALASAGTNGEQL